MLKTFDNIVNQAQQNNKKKLVVAGAEDDLTLTAVARVQKEGIAEPILVGNEEEILKIAQEIRFNVENVVLIDAKSPEEIAEKAVLTIKQGKAEILMKGLIETSTLLKAVLNKEKGLKVTSTLTGMALLQIPKYHKLLAVADAGVIPKPDIKEMVAIINNTVTCLHKIGINNPKVALASAVETINPKIDSTVQAAIITKMNQRKQITNCIIDGPLALDDIISKTVCKHKNIVTEVGGDADIIVVPDIDSGNIFIKSLVYFADAIGVSFVLGASIPIIITSRMNESIIKYLSIACASLLT